jgi:ComF family protein
VLSALQQLLLPAECLLCHGLLSFRESDHIVCAPCRTRWRPVMPPWCSRCGQPEPSFGGCRICVDWSHQFTRVRSAVWLEAGARDAAHALKYGGLPRIADDLAVVMARLLPTPERPVTLVPIPLGPARLRRRGYNQSEWLARALAGQWQAPVVPRWLTRTRDTGTQTTLTPTARLANVAGAFSAAARRHWPAVVLVDDVFTTGATLADAARALAAAGAQRITAVTFGRAAIPDFLQGV